MNDCISDTHILERFDVANQITDFAGFEFIDRFAFGNKLPEFEDFVVHASPKKADFVSSFDFAGHQSHIGNRTAIVIVVGVEDHRLKVACRFARWRRDSVDDGRE